MKALVVLADASRQREIADFFSRRLHADVHGGCDTAIDAAAREHFPYVILDAAVPGALDVCRTIRRRPDGDCSYVIAVLSDGTAANLREAMEAGVDDYVSPPLDIGSLQMRMAIAERNLARRLRSPQSAGDGLADRRYRTLVQSMHEGVFLVDERGRIEFANTRMSSLSGYSIDELVGQSADELLVDDDFRARLPGQTLLGSGIGSEEYTLPLRRKDGGHAWVQLVGAPTQTADGRHGSMGIVRDLTEQRKAEEGLKYREEYFRALLDSSTDLISIIGIDGQILYQSPSSERMLGLPPELLTGTDVLDFIHSDDRQAFSAALDAAIAGAEPTTAEMRLRRSGGEWLYVESLCANLVDNPVIGGIVVTSRDITERRRVEAALKRERAFFQQLFDKSPAGIVVLNTQDRVVDANRSFVDLFQFEVDDLAGRRLGTRIVPEDRQNEAQDLSQAVAAGQNVVHETVRKRKDGTDVDVSIVCYPVDVAGRRVGAFGLYTDITERKKAERQLFHEAFHDALTGLPNRSLLSERLERCVKRAKRRDDYQFALLFIDLDGFKGINDTLGHAAGDELLVEMARRLEMCTRPGDTVARLGGDEFTIILDDLNAFEDAPIIADRILGALDRSFDIGGQEVSSSGSIGIAYSSPQYFRAEDLMRDADIAMYRAKSAGKARYEIFDATTENSQGTIPPELPVPPLDPPAPPRAELERGLEKLLDTGALDMYYQPVMSLIRRTVVGFEALARRRTSDGAIENPVVWLPELIGSPLAGRFSRWALEAACLQLARWAEEFPENEGVALSVNLSPSQLEAEDFLVDLDAASRAAGISPATLSFEVPDSVLETPEDALVERLWELRRRGFRVTIQDFGAGRTSLQTLYRLPVDTLKLSPTLLSGIEDGGRNTQVVQAAAAIGESLGLRVVATGVESEAQLEKVRQLGFTYAQGFEIAGPAAADRAAAWIKKPPSV